MVEETSDQGEAGKVMGDSRKRILAVAAGVLTLAGSFSISTGPAQANHTKRKCSRNYSHWACVPRNRADVDCGQLKATDFKVLRRDIYDLDTSDRDRIACES